MSELQIIIGSTRPGRAADQVAPWVISFAFRNKPLMAVGYSGGIGGGERAIEHLGRIAVEVEMVPLRTAMVIHRVAEAFHEAGNPVRAAAATVNEVEEEAV